MTQVANAEKGLTKEDYEEFLSAWYDFDIAQTGFMHVSMLCRFMQHLRDKPFKTFHASEHGRATAGNDEFGEKDIVLLSNLHALVLPGDVLQCFHVFIALLYLHHPTTLLPEDVMDSELLAGYQQMYMLSGLNICAAEGLAKKDAADHKLIAGRRDASSGAEMLASPGAKSDNSRSSIHVRVRTCFNNMQTSANMEGILERWPVVGWFGSHVLL